MDIERLAYELIVTSVDVHARAPLVPHTVPALFDTYTTPAREFVR